MIVLELGVLEVSEEVLTNVFEWTVQGVGAPFCVRRWHDGCRLCTYKHVISDTSINEHTQL